MVEPAEIGFVSGRDRLGHEVRGQPGQRCDPGVCGGIRLLVGGSGAGAAVGLGLFIAFWGGLGFGTMVGGVTWVSQHEEH